MPITSGTIVRLNRKIMNTVTSVSGGRTSAYLAANYPADDFVFALVRIEDRNCLFPDAKIRQQVEDRIQAPFIATPEDDTIIYTMLDLEQFLGKEINWVTGQTFDEVVRTKGGWLPNKLHRYCTTFMKIDPIFYWWAKKYGPGNLVYQNIGYRANEASRAKRMLEKTNADGVLEYHGSITNWPNGKRKWEDIPFQIPKFPLIQDGILKSQITKYWGGKPVRFAPYNNCVGCFHREPLFLRYMFQEHPNKMAWFKSQEGPKKKSWRSDGSYARFEKLLPQAQLYPDDFSACDTGYCEL